MRLSKRSMMIGVGLLALVLLIAYAATAMGLPRYETVPYFSVVGEEPFAPFTDLESTSLIPYYSVVGEVPFAPFTDLESTSLIPYYSVLH
ncbi:MAG: hypothetical protein ACYC77_07225 [Coriobacteriia bacterium]